MVVIFVADLLVFEIEFLKSLEIIKTFFSLNQERKFQVKIVIIIFSE